MAIETRKIKQQVVTQTRPVQKIMKWQELSIYKMLHDKVSNETNVWWWQELSISQEMYVKSESEGTHFSYHKWSVSKTDCK